MSNYSARHAAAPQKPTKKHHGKKVLIVVIAIVVLLAAVYGGGVYYFQSHFLPNTVANGHDVSLQTESDLSSAIDQHAQSYVLAVSAGDFSTSLSAQQMGLSVDAATVASAAMQSERGLSWRWPLELFSQHSYSSNEAATLDQQKLTDSLAAAVNDYNQSATLPQDATVGFSDEQGSYVVNPEVAGTAVVVDPIVSAAHNAALSMQPSVSCDGSAVLQPSVTSSDEGLNAAAQKANQMIALSIPLTVDGQQKLNVGHDQIVNWVSIDSDHNVSVDSAAVATFVRKTVAPACAKSDDAHTYSVDRSKLTKALVNGINSISSDAIEVPLVSKEKAAQADTTSQAKTNWDGSGRYLEVDITNQYARLYDEQGNVLWETSVVTGNTSEGRPTPTGTYAINNKVRDMTLVGADENGDGKADYTSHVDYWMPFIGNSYGFHDATWRSSFGGSIYKSSGSHGCVNLPYSKAQQLFGLVNVGDKVVIHK